MPLRSEFPLRLCRHGLTAAAALFACSAQAQDAPDIVVTGRGLPAPPGERAFATVTLDAEQLSADASGRVENALRDIAGLAQFRRSDARSANPTSQGVTLRGLGGNASSRALVLVDGVPQGDPFGGWIAWPAYLPGRLGGVRVTRGGGSGYAGPGALAGTIELFSADASQLPPLGVAAGYGSRDSIAASAVAAPRLAGGSMTLAADYARGNGFVPTVERQRGPADIPAPYEQGSVSLRDVVAVGAATELQFSALAFSDRRERGTAFSAIRSQGADASIRLVGRGRFGWSVLGYLQARTLANQFASLDAARTAATETLDQYHTPATGIGGRIELAPPIGGDWSLRLGGDGRGVAGRTEELYTYVAGQPTRRREAGGRTLTLGGFADLSHESRAVTLSLGGRVDHWTIADGRLFEAPLAGGVPLTDLRFAARSGWEPTGRAGLAWRVDPGATLRAAVYRGWRLPTLNELYRPFRVGADATAANAGLAPETLNGVEAGIDLDPAAGLTLRATAYWNRLDAAIGNVTLDTGPANFPGVGFVAAGGVYRQRQNLDAIDAKGVEVDLGYRIGPWRLDASYAFTDSHVRASGVGAGLDGLEPAQTARHSGSAGVAWVPRHGPSASIAARYVAPQYEDDQNLRRLTDALTVDARVVVPVGADLAIEGRVENATDTEVQAGISGAGIIERTDPRTFWIGIRYRPFATASNSSR